MRRLLTLALSLSLTGVGPVPLSLCAIFTSKMAECATPKTPSPCDTMNMGDNGTRVVAPKVPCCNLDNAPAAARQRQFVQASLAISSAISVPFAQTSPNIRGARPTDIEHDFSPPPLQPLLCTFLI